MKSDTFYSMCCAMCVKECESGNVNTVSPQIVCPSLLLITIIYNYHFHHHISLATIDPCTDPDNFKE